jgi:hypothetical protein
MSIFADVIEPWWIIVLIETALPLALIWFTWHQYGRPRRPPPKDQNTDGK